MRERIRKISFGDIAATLALFIALGGVSWAAATLPKNSVGKKQLKSNAVVSKKVKDGSLAAGDFKNGQLPTGPAGPKGPVGEQGPQGEPGHPGLTTSVLTGRASVAGIDSFLAPSGISPASLTENSVQVGSPGVPTTAGGLSVRLETAPGGGTSRTFTLRLNGADTAVTCTIGGASTTCENPASTAAIPAGSRLSLRNDVTGAPVASGVQYGLTLQP